MTAAPPSSTLAPSSGERQADESSDPRRRRPAVTPDDAPARGDSRRRRGLRIVGRAVTLVLGTALVYAVYLPTFLVLGLRRRWRRAFRNRVFALWSRFVNRTLGVRVEVRGTPPPPPFLLVANHLSYVDVLVLASHVGARFVAKLEVRAWPVIGILCRSVETIFVDRGARRDVVRVGQWIADGLANGDGVVVFPEGTSSDGQTVSLFRSALLAHAARARLPVHYATLSYRCAPPAPPPHLAICWWGDMTFGRHLLGLLALPRAEATLVFGAEAVADDCRKRLAVRLRQAVAEQFEPVRRDG